MLTIENIETVYMIIGGVICLLLLLLLFSMARNNGLLKKNIELVRSQNDSLILSLNSLTDKTEELGKEYQQLQADLIVKELYDGQSDAYMQAINAARSGASSAEIIDDYGLIKTEADLLVSIHGIRKAALG